jgi:hypothetical protein
MIDETLDLIAGRLSECFHRAEISRVRLDQIRIQLMVANDLIKTIADRAVSPVSIRRLCGSFFDSGTGCELSATAPISSTEQIPIP